MVDTQWNAAHSLDVGGDPFADLPVATRDAVHETAAAVDQLDRDAVELLGHVEVAADPRLAVLVEEAVATHDPLLELVGVGHLVERPHRDLVAGLFPVVRGDGAAHLGQDGVGGSQATKLVLERVVGLVGDGRLPLVVPLPVLREPLGELGDACAIRLRQREAAAQV